MKRVLMIAFHFPPLAGSSGIQRTLRFVQHLPKLGWEALVLSAHPRAYERTSADLLAQIPQGTVVRRAFALDSARHLAVCGSYLSATARPDRWISWKWGGVRQGLRMIDDFKPSAIWSTYPIPTAHQIGAVLHERTGIPWIADFRDPMTWHDHPLDRLTWQYSRTIEIAAVHSARHCCFASQGTARAYQARYPDAAERMVVIENGFDEDSFANAERQIGQQGPLNPGLSTLLHSGIVAPDVRDPTQLFVALRRLKEAGRISASRLRVRFRAAGHDSLLQSLSVEHDVTDIVEICPPIGYSDALGEMRRADGLLILQAANCNVQIPAKLYEYLRARRPILCLSDPLGDTCDVLRRAGVSQMARLNSASEIAELIMQYQRGEMLGFTPDEASVAAGSRAARSAQLARLLHEL